MDSQDRRKPFLQRLIRGVLEALIRGRRVSIDLLFKQDEVELDVTSLVRAQVSLRHPGVEGTEFTGTLNIRPGWLGWIVRRNLPEEVQLDENRVLHVQLPDQLSNAANVDQIVVDDGRFHIGLTLRGLPEES